MIALLILTQCSVMKMSLKQCKSHDIIFYAVCSGGQKNFKMLQEILITLKLMSNEWRWAFLAWAKITYKYHVPEHYR